MAADGSKTRSIDQCSKSQVFWDLTLRQSETGKWFATLKALLSFGETDGPYQKCAVYNTKRRLRMPHARRQCLKCLFFTIIWQVFRFYAKWRIWACLYCYRKNYKRKYATCCRKEVRMAFKIALKTLHILPLSLPRTHHESLTTSCRLREKQRQISAFIFSSLPTGLSGLNIMPWEWSEILTILINILWCSMLGIYREYSHTVGNTCNHRHNYFWNGRETGILMKLFT